MLSLADSEEKSGLAENKVNINNCREEENDKWHGSSGCNVTNTSKPSILVKTPDVSSNYSESEDSVSFIASAPNGEEFLIITRLEPVNGEELIKDKALQLSENISADEAKVRYRSKRREKESDEINIGGETRLSKIESQDFEELLSDSMLIPRNIKDVKENSNWFKSFRPLPLYYTERGKPYLKCPACGAMFFTSTSFQKHLFSHMYKDNDTYVCSFCNYANAEPGMLFAHLSKHQDQCEFCNENLMRKNNFEKHFDACASSLTLKRDRRGRFICTACKLVFDLLPQLEKHWFKHSCKKLRTYQCKECWGLYESKETLTRHKCLKCPVCCEIYDSLHRLKAHTMWTKHYLKCPICSYEFILTMDHEKHLALHRQHFLPIKDHQHCLQSADGKTFQCNLCDKIFYAVPRLFVHLQEDHGIESVAHEDIKNDENKEDISITLLNELKKEETNFGEHNISHSHNDNFGNVL